MMQYELEVHEEDVDHVAWREDVSHAYAERMLRAYGSSRGFHPRISIFTRQSRDARDPNRTLGRNCPARGEYTEGWDVIEA